MTTTEETQTDKAIATILATLDKRLTDKDSIEKDWQKHVASQNNQEN